jgi:hypothetical protein
VGRRVLRRFVLTASTTQQGRYASEHSGGEGAGSELLANLRHNGDGQGQREQWRQQAPQPARAGMLHSLFSPAVVHGHLQSKPVMASRVAIAQGTIAQLPTHW